MNWLLIAILRLLAQLTLGFLYRLSGMLQWILEDVLSYRKDVIRQNLERSFPDKDASEIKRLQHTYYQYLAELVLETIKLQTIKKEDLMDRCWFQNPEVLRDYESNGRNVIIMMGHSGNWEWAGASTALHFKFKMLPVYRRVKNSSFDRFFIELRSRFNSTPVLDTTAFQSLQSAPEPHAVAMLADQTPGAKKGWWLNFLHQPTPFFRGSELLAKRLGYDVVFAHVRREKRGRYSIWLEKYEEQQGEKHALTKAFAQFLEKEIKKQPENWLWSHKRWKHQPREESIWID